MDVIILWSVLALIFASLATYHSIKCERGIDQINVLIPEILELMENVLEEINNSKKQSELTKVSKGE